MTGTILNACGIVAGGLLGLILKKEMSKETQLWIKWGLGALAIYVGLSAFFTSLSGGFPHILKQGFIVLLSLMLGNLTGNLLHLQRAFNRAGSYARRQLSQATEHSGHRFADGFLTCTLLYCLAPLAIIGSIQDGLVGNYQTLGVKALMDGMATTGFVVVFGWGAVLSVVPVVAYQGSITWMARSLVPVLGNPQVLNSVNGTGGLLVFCVALVILNLKKIELGNYLPSLVYAPLLTHLWH